MKCPICASTNTEKIYKDRNAGFANIDRTLDLIIETCNDCSFVFQSSAYTDEYDSIARDVYKDFKKSDIFPFPNRTPVNRDAVDRILRNLPKKEGLNILEIGSNRGDLLFLIKEKLTDANIIGVEPTTFENVRVPTINSFFKKDLFSTKFDVVILQHTLEHIKYPKDMLNEIAEILSSDGIIYIEVPYLNNMLKCCVEEFTPEHVSYFSLKSLNNALGSLNISHYDSSPFLSVVARANHKESAFDDICDLKNMLQCTLKNKEKILTAIKKKSQEGKSIIFYGISYYFRALFREIGPVVNFKDCLYYDDNYKEGFEPVFKLPRAKGFDKGCVVITCSANPKVQEAMEEKLLRHGDITIVRPWLKITEKANKRMAGPKPEKLKMIELTMSGKVNRFLSKQIAQVRKDGFSALSWKAYIAILLLLAVPAVIIVRMLRPLIIIRFRKNPMSRIGHGSVNTELYMCERDAGMHSPRTFDIFYFRKEYASNHQLTKMWQRAMRKTRFSRLVPSVFVHQIDRVSNLLPGASMHRIPRERKNGNFDTCQLIGRTKTHLAFTPEEEERGRKQLQALGISASDSFVCLHARDTAYLDYRYRFSKTANLRRQNHRDCSIGNYIPAAQELTRRGYFAVRMGYIVKKPLDAANPMIIDYAVKHRTDFLDIYLGAKCRFFVTSCSGIYGIPLLFRRPIAYTNFIPLNPVFASKTNDLYIPKKLWLKNQRRFLSFGEIFNSRIREISHSEEYESLGIEPVENTPEEIRDMVTEMDERIKGTWQSNAEAEDLRLRLRSLFKPGGLKNNFLLQMGSEFLRQNKRLIK